LWYFIFNMSEHLPDHPFESNSHDNRRFADRVGNKTVAASMGVFWGAGFAEGVNGLTDLVTGHTIFNYGSLKEQSAALGLGIAYGLIGIGGPVYRDLIKNDSLEDNVGESSKPPQE
jgi:hypothetical protein